MTITNTQKDALGAFRRGEHSYVDPVYVGTRYAIVRLKANRDVGVWIKRVAGDMLGKGTEIAYNA